MKVTGDLSSYTTLEVAWESKMGNVQNPIYLGIPVPNFLTSKKVLSISGIDSVDTLAVGTFSTKTSSWEPSSAPKSCLVSVEPYERLVVYGELLSENGNLTTTIFKCELK
jgi:hypothetical protein